MKMRFERGFLATRLEAAVSWARSRSLWVATISNGCCAAGSTTSVGARGRLAEAGLGLPRLSPRHADLLVVAGRLSLKMVPVVLDAYEEMSPPRWTIAFGACAASGGLFNTYATLQGLDRILPVDAYVPGCPPEAEALAEAILRVRELAAGRQKG
jgi:NADH-quinone oxidoreductase subunit B